MQLANLGGAALALSPAEYSKLIADETEKWAKVVTSSQSDRAWTFYEFRYEFQ